MIDINILPKLSQRQDSLNDQILDLIKVANHLGMYDAADFLAKVNTKPDNSWKKWGVVA